MFKSSSQQKAVMSTERKAGKTKPTKPKGKSSALPSKFRMNNAISKRFGSQGMNPSGC